ncbi:hypothetical protein [Rufibacter hautae]|uniref:Uncharacterized protein n=1 Tax=Rufibacter hautae TaxID=2595005 RepID=A0A5B6TGH1_9BACT|nr:hypothetical protein [Rufibacter hautae]KAA3438405.1 hypothetical protein FOA19_14295 [Rufibacter hautae]
MQKVALKRFDYLPRPGSLLLNRKEVEIRSDLEKEILIAIQQAEWGNGVAHNERYFLKRAIEECIDFTKKIHYIKLAKSLR